MIYCPDCFKDGVSASVVFDPKHQGDVCPRCDRVFLILNRDPHYRHYATEKGCKTKMRRDIKEQRARSVSTKALIAEILRPSQ